MQNKTKKILHYIIPLMFIAVCYLLFTKIAFAAEPSVGAVNNWFSLNGATNLSVDITPNHGENGYHFYSLSPFFQDKNYGLYTGIQTNGNLGNGVDVGNIFIFSVWKATAVYPENGSTSTPFDGEGEGYSLRIPFNWVVGKKYNLLIERKSFDSNLNGWRWSSTIKDVQTGASMKIGEILAPAEANQLSGGSAFHERYVGNVPSCTQSTSNLEAASVTFANLKSDKPTGFNGTPARNNVFNSDVCSAYIHSYSNSTTAITGFGITQTDFNSLFPVANIPKDDQPGASEKSPENPSSSQPKTNNQTKNPVTGETDKPISIVEESDSDEYKTDDTSNEKREYTASEDTGTNGASESSSRKNLKIAIAATVFSISLGIFTLLKSHILKI